MESRLGSLLKLLNLPKISINLMLGKTSGNDPFYADMVKRWHALATARHPKFFFIRQFQYGFALCRLPLTFEEYFQSLKKSARWNYRKAIRKGYEVKRFDVNTKRDEISAILKSTPIRQGKLPKALREGHFPIVNDPPSRTPFHDFFYMGAFRNEKLLAYVSCAIMGELCNLNDIYGHAAFENDGLVPLLLIMVAETVYKSYSTVKYYGFGTYFGARATMRQFKRKFAFYPYHVTWQLDNTNHK
jgi:hypothetical protein